MEKSERDMYKNIVRGRLLGIDDTILEKFNEILGLDVKNDCTIKLIKIFMVQSLTLKVAVDVGALREADHDMLIVTMASAIQILFVDDAEEPIKH